MGLFIILIGTNSFAEARNVLLNQGLIECVPLKFGEIGLDDNVRSAIGTPFRARNEWRTTHRARERKDFRHDVILSFGDFLVWFRRLRIHVRDSHRLFVKG